MGRKKLDGKVVIWSIKLTLRQGVDDDLIAFKDSIPNYKSAQMVKSALRGGNISVQNIEDDSVDELMNDLFL
jgi:hypothetical protein